MICLPLWRIVFLFVVALVVVPSASLPSSLGRYSSNSAEPFAPDNRSSSPQPSAISSTDKDYQLAPNDSSPGLSPAPLSNQTFDSKHMTNVQLPRAESNGFDFPCTGPQYFSPEVEVDCYYWDHGEHNDYYVVLPPVGLSYSHDASARWADFLLYTLQTVRGVYSDTDGLDWWEIEESNNWGRGITVHFRSNFFFRGSNGEILEQVEGAVREAMCDGASDVSFKDGGCRYLGKSDVFYNIGKLDPEKSWDNGVKDDE